MKTIKSDKKNLSLLSKEELINKILHHEKELEKHKFLAFCDVMTTRECNKEDKNIVIYNRTYWELVYRVEHKNDECDFYLIDLNDLKLINDTKGHVHGDKHICDCIKFLSAFGTIFRLGGDEFVLVPDKSKQDELKAYLEKQQLDLPFAYVYEHKMPTDSFSEILKSCDNKMYAFKSKQKNNSQK